MQVKCIVIDEISMMGQHALAALDRKLRTTMGMPCTLFGGINIVLCGDFYQLPPVKDHVLHHCKKNASDEELRGYHIYKTVTSANTVILDTIKRTDDLEYAALQQRVRDGEWGNGELADRINTRVNADFTDDVAPAPVRRPNHGAAAAEATETPTAPKTAQDQSDYRPIFVSLNKTRTKMHEGHMRSMSDKLQEAGRDLPILVQATIKPIKRRTKIPNPKHRKYLRPEERHYLHTLPDNKFDRLPPVFFLYAGAYVLFSQNMSIKYGIANGTRGRVVGYQFPPGTIFKDSTYKDIKVRIPMRPQDDPNEDNDEITHPVRPDFVLVEVLSAATLRKAPGQPPNLPRNVVAVPVITQSVSTNIPLPENIHQKKHRTTVGVTITQVPLRQAAVLTNYSIQGNQYSRFIIAESMPSQFYIPFSRGKKGLNSLILRFHLDRLFTSRAKPSPELLAAMTNLRTLHDATKARVIAHTSA
jgi:hypothetical protein